MTDPLSIATTVRCLAALLLVLGASTALGASLMARASTPRRRDHLFAVAVIVPVCGLIAVSMALRSLT